MQSAASRTVRSGRSGNKGPTSPVPAAPGAIRVISVPISAFFDITARFDLPTPTILPIYVQQHPMSDQSVSFRGKQMEKHSYPVPAGCPGYMLPAHFPRNILPDSPMPGMDSTDDLRAAPSGQELPCNGQPGDHAMTSPDNPVTTFLRAKQHAREGSLTGNRAQPHRMPVMGWFRDPVPNEDWRTTTLVGRHRDSATRTV